MKKNKINKNRVITISAITLLLVITIGYALLNANLSIIGIGNFSRTTWNIHFENIEDDSNVDLDENDSAAVITPNKPTEVRYTVSLSKPGDYYEFTVDAKNDGNLDGMVNLVTSTIKIGNGAATPITTSPSNLPSYVAYTESYANGNPIEQYHLLRAGEKETYYVSVEYRTDIDASDLPDTNQTIELTFGVEYVQKDENAIDLHPITTLYTANIYDQDWQTIYGESNNSVVYLDKEFTNGITTYETPLQAMAALKLASGGTTDRPFFLKHYIQDDEVIETDIGFVVTDAMVTNARNGFMEYCDGNQECIDSYVGMTAGTYYLKRKEIYDENNDCKSEYVHYNEEYDYYECVDPYWDENTNTMLTAFGYSHCRYSLDCGVEGLYVSLDNRMSYATDSEYSCFSWVENKRHSACTINYNNDYYSTVIYDSHLSSGDIVG